MAPTFFKQVEGKLVKQSIPSLESLKGWYRTITSGDFNGDGRVDFAFGNHGLNTRFKVSSEHPVSLFLNDLDQNGSIEQIFTWRNQEVEIPYALKHELEKQVPSIKKKYIKYSDYNDQSLTDIFPKEIVDKSIRQEVNHLESGVLMNLGGGNFEWKSFPIEVQKTWVFAIQTLDLNQDGILDLVLGGNLSQAKPEVGKYDAGFGEVLIGKGDGTFEFLPNRVHGLHLDGDIREFSVLGSNHLLVVKNNAAAEIWKF